VFKIDNVPLDDKKTWDLICEGNTLGVFQYDSRLGRHWCKTIKPRDIDELGAIGALLRPGSLKAYSGDPPKNMTQRYADRKHGLEPNESYHPALDSILNKTYNVIVYQEQSMAIAQKIAGFDLNNADQLRKAIGKKDPQLMSDLESEFVEGCKKVNLVTEEQAKEIFGWIKASQRYSFNASHSISYAINGYKCAFAKAHYPLQFYTAYLQGCKWKQKPRQEIKNLVIDGRSNNIEFVPPNIIDLQAEPYIKNKKYVAFGLSSIRDIGDSARQKLVGHIESAEVEIGRKIDQWSWMDFLLLLGHKIQKRNKIGSKVMDALMFGGALDCFGITRHKMQMDYELFQEFSAGQQKFAISRHISLPFNSLDQAASATAPLKKEGGGSHSQKYSDKLYSLHQVLLNPQIAITDDPRFLALSEEKYLGIAISCSQSDGSIQADISNYTCDILSKGIGIKNITFVAEISVIKRTTTKKGKNPGQEMAFIDTYDKTGAVDCVIFPNVWPDVEDIINQTDAFYIMCSRSKQGSLCVEKLEKIT
jgi:DNA polymerase III alpha subunit